MIKTRNKLVFLISAFLIVFTGSVFGIDPYRVSDSPAFQKQLERSLNGLNGVIIEDESDKVLLDKNSNADQNTDELIPRGIDTCGSTACGGTCNSTCGSTCDSTCASTCSGHTCGSTCDSTCESTCGSVCDAAEAAIAEAQDEVAAAEAALEEALESGDEIKIQRAEQAAERAIRNKEEADKKLNDIREKQDTDIAENQANQNGSNSSTNGQTAQIGGDPVRLAIGSAYFNETDLSFKFNSLDIIISRNYQSDQTNSHSFGIGWRFNYDTRVIMGAKSNAEEEAELFEQTANQTWALYNQTLADYNSSLADMNTAYTDAVNARNAAATAVSKAQTAVNKANATGDSSLKAQANSLLAQANSLKAQADAHFIKVNDTRNTLLASHSDIEAMYDVCVEIEALAQQSRREADLATSNETRNRYIVNETDPWSQEHTGNETVTLIDEAGVPHLYFIDGEPDYESTVEYADGSTNYYTYGSTLTPSLPIDDTLELMPDGSYLLTKKNKTQYIYSFYGQIIEIIDTNDNKIEFHYSDTHELIEVVDDFGRILDIERENGRIVKTTDPKGREFFYSYDSDGRLTSRTDSVGAAVAYVYSGNLITEIIKPDGSSRKYVYTDLGENKVVDHNIDEEGNTEYFRYYPEEKYTEYINASGVLERYYYDERYLTTKIEYGDGSFVEKEYDENNNLIKQTDEIGQVYQYSYDANRNLIEAVDPNGNVEKWSYNEFNKINSHIDKLGNTIAYSYDSNGNLISVNYPDSTSVSYVYNTRGQVTEYTDQLGNKTVYSYDAYGYVSSSKDPLDYEKHFNNDILGNTVQYTDPEGNKTIYEYNYDNKIIKITDSEGIIEEYIYNNRKDIVQVVDKNGNNTVFEYDKRHLLLTVTNPLGETVEYSYRADGKMAEKIIEVVNHTQYEYDLRGRLIQKTQVETGASTGYEYDAAGQLTAVIDPNSNRTEYGYSLLGQVVCVKDPEGNTRFIDYNANGKITSVTDRLGNTILYDYDEMNRLIRETDPLFNETGYAYDAAGNLVALTDKNGRVTGYEYDPLNRLAGVTDPAGFSELLEYDPRGLLAAKTDKRCSRTVHEYDSLGRLTRSTDPLEGIRAYTYDPAGNLITRNDENGNTTTFEYDALNQVAKRVDAYGAETAYTYNYLGKVAGVTDALGNERAYQYDELGRLIKETDPLGAFKSYEYDKNGNLLTVLDELSRPQSYIYDSLNRLIKETNALGEEIQYSYDAVGNLAQETDAAENPYTYEYDKLGRLVREINRLGSEQGYSYDPSGNLVGKTDFNGKAFVYSYDALDRLTRVLYADGTAQSFSYDPAGNIVGAENEAGALEYAYDGINRLIQANDLGMGKSIGYEYDAAGNRLKISWLEDERVTTYTYGQINELLSVTDPEEQTSSFEYNPLGREIRKILANGVVTDTSYDPARRITAIKNEGPKGWGHDKRVKSLAYLYNAAGERTFQVEENGQITAYEYDEIGRIESVYYPWMSGKKNQDFRERLELGLYPEYKSGKKDEYSFGLPYLPLNGKGEKEFKDNLKGLLKDKDELFKDYSKLDKKLKGRWNVGIGEGATEFASRLDVPYEVEEVLQEAYEGIAQKHGYMNTSQWTWQESFSYDVNSNRASKANGWGVIDYSYNPANEILIAGNRDYEHDLNGNLTKEALGDIEGIYTYNPENRVTNIYSDLPGFLGSCDWRLEAGVRYEYDAFGRRSSRVEYVEHNLHKFTWKEETNQSYIYDGLSFDVLAELRDTDFSVNGHNPPGWGGWNNRNNGRFQPISEYIMANGNILSRTDFRESNGRWGGWPRWKNKEYYSHDVLGSVIMLTDSRGHNKETYSYDAFGNRYGDRIPRFGWPHGNRWPFHGVNQYGYNGKRYDPAVGLADYGFRDYSPQLGRFTTLDPIRDSHNWYVYVNNDPINFIDLFGLDDVAAFYDRDENILEVYYADTTTGAFEESTYTATNEVKTPEERENEPVSYDPDGEGPADAYDYFPEGFPDSPEEGWDMGYSYESDDPAMGPTIPTNAHREVTTYVYNERTLEWEESGTVTDTGYSIHGGEGTTTWGCIRTSDPYAEELQPLVDTALDSGGEAKLFTTGGKNN